MNPLRQDWQSLRLARMQREGRHVGKGLGQCTMVGPIEGTSLKSQLQLPAATSSHRSGSSR